MKMPLNNDVCVMKEYKGTYGVHNVPCLEHIILIMSIFLSSEEAVKNFP